MNYNEIWNNTLAILKKTLPRATYETCLEKSEIEVSENNVLIITVPGKFAMDWLTREYSKEIKDALLSAAGMELDIDIRYKSCSTPSSHRENKWDLVLNELKKLNDKIDKLDEKSGNKVFDLQEEPVNKKQNSKNIKEMKENFRQQIKSLLEKNYDDAEEELTAFDEVVFIVSRLKRLAEKEHILNIFKQVD